MLRYGEFRRVHGKKSTGIGLMHTFLATSVYADTETKIDDLVKSRKVPFSVIPAKAGIQYIQLVSEGLDSGACPGPRSGVHRSDDFLRGHQD